MIYLTNGTPTVTGEQNSDDDNSYYHRCLLLIPPASICLYLHINILLSLLTSALLTISLSFVCFSCMCFSEDPLVQQIGSLSLCSQLDRENINASLSFKKKLSSMAPSTPAFLGFSPSTSPDLSYRLSQWEMADKYPCCGYNPHQGSLFLLTLSLSVWLSYAHQVSVVCTWWPRGRTPSEYHIITKLNYVYIYIYIYM